MIIVQTTLAYNVYKDKSKGPFNNLNSWDEYITKLFIYDGIEYDPSEPHYDIKNTYANLNIRYAQPFGAAYADILVFFQMDGLILLFTLKVLDGDLPMKLGILWI